MLHRLERHALWVIWILIASLLFTILPVGPYGLLGWFGATAPLSQLVFTRLTRQQLFILGLSAMTLTQLLDGGVDWFQFLAAFAAFAGGVLLTPPRTRLQPPGETYSAAAQARLCEQALRRELGRARRYDRPVTVLSVAYETPGADLVDLLKTLTGQLHLYCQTFLLDGRVIAIVPELEADERLAMHSRIFQAIRQELLGAVNFGYASFPTDAITSAALIEIADANRQPFTQAESTNGAGQPSPPQPGGGFGSGLP